MKSHVVGAGTGAHIQRAARLLRIEEQHNPEEIAVWSGPLPFQIDDVYGRAAYLKTQTAQPLSSWFGQAAQVAP